MPHHNNLVGKVIVIDGSPQNSCSNRSCILDDVKGNGQCHDYGLVNYPTTLPCNRCNVSPLYVQEKCRAKARGCSMTYSNCVKELTCNHSNCNTCS